MADLVSLAPEWAPAVVHLWANGKPLGTGFIVGPRVALTCHHCVVAAGSSVIELRGTADDGTKFCWVVNDMPFADRPFEADAAILRFSEDAPTVLPISAARTLSLGTLVSYGFPGTDPRQSRVRIDLEPRGLKSFPYSNYCLSEALSLAGDPAAPGMSGSPVVDTTAGVVVGMIVGGPDFDGRAMALPLWTLDSAENHFPAFAVAANANRQNLLHRGWAMNLLRAKNLCRRQVDDVLLRLKNEFRYNAGRIVPRGRLTSALASFLLSDRSAFVVRSGPNSGKTTAMAQAAEALSERSLFIEGLNVSDARISLVRCLDNLLSTVTTVQSGETIDLVSRTLGADDTPLILFVDGVNEISDDLSKVERWVVEAISEARARNIKLVLSCRTDYWSALYVPSEEVEAFDLGYFTNVEATAAAKLYDVGTKLPSELARHPLMFKILSRLGSASNLTEKGRFSAIKAFLGELIKATPGVTDRDAYVGACTRMVALLGSEEEVIAWDVAANALGGAPYVDKLIQSGVFRTSDRTSVRFAFDEITAVLRPPLPGDLASLTRLWGEALTNGRVATRMLADMARAAAEDGAGRVSTHAQAFVLAFAEFRKSEDGERNLLYGQSFAPFGIIFASLTSDFPARFSADAELMVNHFLDAVVELARSNGPLYGEAYLVPAIMGLDISLGNKFRVLVELLELCRDDDLREKDIFDRHRRVRLEAEASNPPKTVAGALLRQALDDPAEFVRLALPRLQDNRYLEGRRETTVGSVLTSILRLSALGCFSDLYVLLLEQSHIDANRRLLYWISSDHPREAVECSIAALSTSRALAVMELAIDPSLKSLGAGYGPIALLDKLRTVMQNGTPETRKMAALLIRISEPDDLPAWDELANMVRSRSADAALYPVPAARAGEFLEILSERSDDFAISQMRSWNGDSRVEAAMAALAIKMFDARPDLHGELAALAEQRLYRARQSTFFSPWIALGMRVANAPTSETRGRLIYFAGPRSDGAELSLQVWSEMLRGPAGLALSEDALDMVAEKGQSSSDDFLLAFLRPLAHEHGPALLGALKGWMQRRREFLFKWRDEQEERDAIEHLLELLVKAIGERYPVVAAGLRERRASTSDWLAVWAAPD